MSWMWPRRSRTRFGRNAAPHSFRSRVCAGGSRLSICWTRSLAIGLTSGAPSPIDYGDVPKPEALLAEDKEIERYPLAIPAENVTIVPVTQVFEGASLLAAPAGAQ